MSTDLAPHVPVERQVAAQPEPAPAVPAPGPRGEAQRRGRRDAAQADRHGWLTEPSLRRTLLPVVPTNNPMAGQAELQRHGWDDLHAGQGAATSTPAGMGLRHTRRAG